MTTNQDTRHSGSEQLVTIVVAVIATVILLGTVLLWTGWLGGDSKQTVSAEVSPAAPNATDNSKDSDKTSVQDKSTEKERAEQAKKILLSQAKRAADDPFALGKTDAPVVVVEFADYKCPYCNLWHTNVLPKLKPIIDQGKVRYEWRNVPIVGGEQSRLLAIAARAAAAQGKFWEYHNAIYAGSPKNGKRNWTAEEMISLADKVGVSDIEKFKQDLQSPQLAKQVDEEMNAALSLGMQSVPSFAINDVGLQGSLPAEEFLKIVNSKLGS